MSTGRPCARCGDYVAQGASYSSEGELVCAACEAREDLLAGAERAASGLVSMAFGALALGALSLLFNPLFLASIGAIASAVTWFATVRRNPDYAARLGRRKLLCWALLGVGLLFASLDLLRLLLGLVGVSLMLLR